jgi:hypothetical protein
MAVKPSVYGSGRRRPGAERLDERAKAGLRGDLLSSTPEGNGAEGADCPLQVVDTFAANASTWNANYFMFA